MSTSAFPQSYVFWKSVRLFFIHVLLPRWNCELYERKMKKNVIMLDKMTAQSKPEEAIASLFCMNNFSEI